MNKLKYIMFILLTSVYSYNCKLINDHVKVYYSTYTIFKEIYNKNEKAYNSCVKLYAKNKCIDSFIDLKNNKKLKFDSYRIYKELVSDYKEKCSN